MLGRLLFYNAPLGGCRLCSRFVVSSNFYSLSALGGVSGEVLLSVYCWGCAVLLFEEFDEVGCVGDVAVVANLGDRLARRDEQQSGLEQSLSGEPAVGRHIEVAAELLLE